MNRRPRSNIEKAEDMLLRYIEERRKLPAQLALETLRDVAPEHPRLAEYSLWVQELDQELLAQKKLEDELAAGHQALQNGDLEAARRHLAALQSLDADAAATRTLVAEIGQVEWGLTEDADIESIQRRFEELLAAGRTDEAEKEIERLAEHEVTKVTLDRLRRRLVEARGEQIERRELEIYEAHFTEYLRSGHFQAARDVAQDVDLRFPRHPRGGEMFTEVARQEAAARRRDSIQEGINSLERFLDEGRLAEARIAIKFLRGKVDDDILTKYEAQMEALS